MKVIVYATPGCELIQNGKVIKRNIDTDNDLWDVCYEHNINNDELFQIKETINSFILRVVFNILIFSTYVSPTLINAQSDAKKKNKQIASFIFMPLFRSRGRIKIKPIKCNDDTVITLFLLKSKIPFMVEVENGEIEILEHKRGFKK